MEGVLGVRDRAKHPVAVRVELNAVRRDELGEGVLFAGAGGCEQLALVRRVVGAGGSGSAVRRHRFGSQNATSPPSGLETTLRHPAGPSRGSSSTAAPSWRARSVHSPIRATST